MVIDALPPSILVPSCFTALEVQQILMQGFDLDPEWLLRGLPAEQAEGVLGREIQLHAAGTQPPGDPDVTAGNPLCGGIPVSTPRSL